MSVKPLVSVLMTSYNRQKYISEAIKSVLASSYQNFELIIVDDASTDNTVAIAMSFKDIDDRVRVYVNKKNLSDYHNRNKAASYAKGKYIKYLDSDDIIYPWGLEAMVMSMEQYPEAGYGLISYGIPPGTKYPFVLSPTEAYNAFFFDGSMIITGPSGAIIRKDAFDLIGGFSGKKFIGDTEMWLLLSQKFPLVAMPLDLVWWRQHEEQQIKEELSNSKVEIQRFQLYSNSLTSLNCPLPRYQSSMAFRNLKNIKSRNLIKLLLKGNVTKASALYKGFKLAPQDIFMSLRNNQYPSKK
jgi:glycosyltransferase involved in cell wall biosynthesis